MMPPPAQNNVLGAAYVVACCAFIAGSLICAKLVQQPDPAGGSGLHALQAAWGRFVFGFAGVLLVAAWRWPGLDGARWGLHGARTVCGLGGVILTFAALTGLRVADATALSFLSGLFAMVFAIVLLGERVGPWRWAAAALSIAGVVLVTRPGTEAFQWAALLALGAAALMGMELILIKRLSDGREPRLRILLINNALGAALASAMVLAVWRAPSAEQWAALVGAGLFMVAGQSLFLRGIAIAEANVAAPFFYTTLVFSGLYAFVLFGEMPPAIALAGYGAIVGGALVLGWRERLAQKRLAGQRGTAPGEAPL